jgi:hypothetical protein
MVWCPVFPPIVLFRPSFARFGISDIYGAGPSASTPPHCRKFVILLATMEETTMEEETIADAPGATTFTLYIPDFLEEYSLSDKSLEAQKNELLRKDWLTSGLTHEIETLFPTRAEIQVNDDNKRDPIAFQHKIAQLFPLGRIFASFKQIDQAADMFLGAWAIKKTSHSKSIQCAYSATHDKKDRKHPDVSKRRKLEPTLKSVYKCPFIIRYSFVAYCKNRALKKPDIFYRVKITHINYVHACQMTTIFHRQALQKSGCLQPDLNGLNDIMSLLREKPMLQSDVLRPLLAKYLPFYTATDSMFIVNFRLRAQHWLVTNGDKELTMEEARHVSSTRKLASEEFLLKDDNPMLKQNLTALLRKVMQEDSSTWDALRFLDQMKESNPGFDYRVKYDAFGRPEAVCWMLPEMRSDLLRFGNCLFLDSQKRQYNTVGWPYIGPVVKDSEMQVRCVAESICLEESHRMYVWIILMLVEMEPRFTLSFIDIIFGDQGLTDQILIDLGISLTCILRGDYHHLINEVWPHTFGTHLYQKIRGYLDRMLLGSKSEWELSYTSAKQHLLHDAEKFSSLEQIYNNPSHFAGWFLKKIEGNLLLHGSVPAEQNHSSVAAHLGAGASWSVVEQVSKLLSRQTHLTSKRRHKDSQAYVASLKYKSRFQDQDAFDDEAAKKQLSQYAYDNLFLVEYKTSRRLQFAAHENDTLVWPNGQPPNCDQHVLIRAGQRCTCERRLAFNHQCRHELCRDGKLDLAKYSSRWLNRRTFNATLSTINQQILLAEPQTNIGEAGGLSEDDDQFYSHGVEDETRSLGDVDTDEEITLSSLAGNGASRHEKLTYQFVAEKATNLVRLAQSDPITLGSLCSLLDQLASRLRNSQSIEVQSYDTSVPSRHENPGSLPVLGTLKAAPNTYQQRRKISRHEARRQIVHKRRSPLLSLVGHSNELDFLPQPRAKGKTCSICRCPKHQRGSCPKIHKYKKRPFDMNKDMMSRHELSAALSKVSRYQTDYRPTTDVREISSTTPNRMLGVVIHRRFFVNPSTNSRMCLECTMLDHIGDPHSTFQNFLFTSECISVYVARSKSNVVVCELEDACTEGYESFGFPLSQTQPKVQYLSQSDQMGSGFASTTDQMGDGLSEPL